MTISYIYKLAAASSSRANLSLANNVMANRSYKIHVYSLVFDVDEFLFLSPLPLLLTFTSKRKIITFARYCFTFVLRRASKILQPNRFGKRNTFFVFYFAEAREGRGGIAKSHEKNIAILKVKGTCLFHEQGFQPGHLRPQLTDDLRHRVLVDHRPIDHALRPLRESQRAGCLVVTSARWRDSWKQRVITPSFM